MIGKSKKFGYLGVLACAFVLSAVAFGAADKAAAQEKFPARAIEVIVPAPPGGGTDILSRILADAAEPFLGQKVVVINKSGGSGTIGVNAVVQAKPEGYELGCFWNAPLTMVPHVLKVAYTLDDFSYITQVSEGPMIFCVRSEFPAKTAEEFFEYARKNPGKLTYASDGVGNLVQFSGERVFHAEKVKLRMVPYGGAGESIKALLGGHVDVYGGSVPPAMPHMKAGTVRAVFVTTKERTAALPDVVAVSDLGHPEIATPIWRGIVGPKGLSPERIAILEKAFRQAAQTQKMKEKLMELGEWVVAYTGKHFEEHVRSEAAAMTAVAKELGLAPQ
jgi:tripartite-type tricarboxylate transporter receptor subunit TctC